MFYDGRGSNVYGLNFQGQKLYSNEYGPEGEILYSIDYSNVSFGCTLYDEDLGSYIDQSSGAIGPFDNLTYSVYTTPLIKMLKGFKGNNHTTERSVDWSWIMIVCGDPRYQDPEDFMDCVLDVVDEDDEDGDGSGGDNPDDECTKPKYNTDCSGVCKTIDSCKKCCDLRETRCEDKCKEDLPCHWLGKGLCILQCWWSRKTCEGSCATLPS